MTGVLLIDGDAGIDGLFYGPHDFRADWVRGGLEFNDGRKLLLHDPRRLGRFEIDPDLSEARSRRADADAKAVRRLVRVDRGDGPAIKARLLDQSRVAGVGNLLADEMLFRAGIDPRTPTGTLERSNEQRPRSIARSRQTMRTLQRRGGSHLGDHMEARFPGGRCPRTARRCWSATIGGRTTYWCATHQV